MKNVSQQSKVLLFTGLLVIVIGASAWQYKQKPKEKAWYNKASAPNCDTAAPRANYTNEINIRINADSIGKAVQASLSAIDFSKIQQELNASLANINFNEINKNIELSLKSVNWDKMKVDIAKSLDEAKASIARINTKELQNELAKIKVELNSQQLQESLNNIPIQEQVQVSLEKLKEQLGKLKTELNNYKSLTNALRQDGLLKGDQQFKIELKDNELYINGVKQSRAVTEKYRRFYPGKTNFSITDNNDPDGDEKDSTDL